MLNFIAKIFEGETFLEAPYKDHARETARTYRYRSNLMLLIVGSFYLVAGAIHQIAFDALPSVVTIEIATGLIFFFVGAYQATAKIDFKKIIRVWAALVFLALAAPALMYAFALPERKQLAFSLMLLMVLGCAGVRVPFRLWIPYVVIHGVSFPIVVVIYGDSKDILLKLALVAIAFAASIIKMWDSEDTRVSEFVLKTQLQEVLKSTLPESIIPQIMSANRGEYDLVRRHERVTILFLDIVGFSSWAMRSEAKDMVDTLGKIFARFDEVISMHGAEKIKTIGDAYMVCFGAPIAHPRPELAALDLAMDLRETMVRFRFIAPSDLQVRIGIHTGPVIAGVIGRHRYVYDLWGPTVNLASRLEGLSEPGQILVSEAVQVQCQDKFQFSASRMVHAKGIGAITVSLAEKPLLNDLKNSVITAS